MATTDIPPFKHIRLTNIHPPNELPYHPNLNNEDTSQTNLSSFCSDIVGEASQLISTHAQDETLFRQCRHSRDVPSAVGGYDVEIRTSKETLQDSWYVRKSLHKEIHVGWKDFEEGLLGDPKENEFHYLMDVYDRQVICEWPVAERGVGVSGETPWDGDVNEEVSEDGNVSGEAPKYVGLREGAPKDTDLTKEVPEDKPAAKQVDLLPPGYTLKIYEMAHKGYQKGFKKRRHPNKVFPTLVLTWRGILGGEPAKSFLVVQIPVNLEQVPAAKYSNGDHQTLEVAELEQREPITLGQYVTIDHCYRNDQTPKVTQWQRAMAIDASMLGKQWHGFSVDRPMASIIRKDMCCFTNWILNQKPEFLPPPALVGNPEGPVIKDSSEEDRIKELQRDRERKKRSSGAIEPESLPPKRSKNTRTKDCSIL